MSYIHHPLASKITTQANALRESWEFLELVTPTTAELLKFWFDEWYMDSRNNLNFHDGQRQAILNTIYCHEILKVTNVSDMYNKVHSTLDLEEGIIEDIMDTKRYSFPRYCMKMATGTGKTRVLNALLIRQFLNAHEGNPGFTKNFLIVAPGLIVYDRLLDSVLWKINSTTNQRNFNTSDYYLFNELFIPWQYKELIYGFLQNNTVSKEEIGRKVVGNGQILITNRHQLSPQSEEEEQDYDIFENPEKIIQNILPTRPGISAGNSLETLDRAYLKWWILDYCKSIPDLVVFNDEAHHLWENTSASAKEEDKKRQQAINQISENKKHFIQIDFSATPFIEKQSGKNSKKAYFPHIITDFTIQEAIRWWLVKSLTLDERKDIASLKDEELDYNAERDEDNSIIWLSNGQKIMIQAGLKKLSILEQSFTEQSLTKYPKMLIVCEDTFVIKYVTEFLKDCGYSEDEYVEIHSNKKWEIKEDERNELKQKVFWIDKLKNPKVIISVLMLREWFDVNNICVIVPLRSASSSILLEQTIGRWLRLMRREQQDMRLENVARLAKKQEPASMIDILTIIEHPKFKAFYDSLIEEWLMGTDTSSDEELTAKAKWDLIAVSLKDNYKDYDLFYSYIISDVEEVLKQPEYTLEKLQPISWAFTRWKAKAGERESFRSTDVLSKTRYGDYDVEFGLLSAKNYNDYISKLVNRISQHTSNTTDTINAKGFGEHGKSHYPVASINLNILTDIVINYIEHKLFNQTIDYFQDSNRRVLMIENVAEHIIKQIIAMIIGEQQSELVGEAESVPLYLSSIDNFLIRENYAIDVQKSIYPKLQYPSSNGWTEKEFIQYLDNDSLVLAFCKIYEQKHNFFKFRFVRDDGIPANYFPDFIVKTQHKIYIVETKAKKDLSNPNVLRKKKSTINYLKRINQLKPEQRDNREREYVLLSDAMFYQLRDNGANIIEMMEATRLVEDSSVRDGLFQI
jgi:type III restriction enzyme